MAPTERRLVAVRQRQALDVHDEELEDEAVDERLLLPESKQAIRAAGGSTGAACRRISACARTVTSRYLKTV